MSANPVAPTTYRSAIPEPLVPHAYNGAEISEETVLTFSERPAGRLAYNAQPWRCYARRGTPAWDSLLGLLNNSTAPGAPTRRS
jgi:hypothetical protein